VRMPRRERTPMLRRLALLASLLAPAAALAAPPAPVETPYFAASVAEGRLPPVAQRVPAEPRVLEVEPEQGSAPRQGGEAYTLMASAKETRQIVVLGYSRLVGYNAQLELEADILAGIDVHEGRIFTLHLRPSHRWSDGAPFTSEDFR